MQSFKVNRREEIQLLNISEVQLQALREASWILTYSLSQIFLISL